MRLFELFLVGPLTVTAVVAAVAVLLYSLLFVYLVRNQVRRDVTRTVASRWLILVVIASALSLMPHILSLSELPGSLTLPALGVYLSMVTMLLFSRLSLRFLHQPIRWYLTLLGLAWLAGTFYAGFHAEQLTLGTSDWQRRVLSESDWLGLAVAAGWAVLFIFHMVVTVRAQRRAHLPELANRVLFWAVIVPLFFMGALLSISGSYPWMEVGWGIQFVALVGAAYGMTLYRIFNMRDALRQAFRTWASVLVFAIVMLTLGLATWAIVDTLTFMGLAALSLIAALLAFLLYKIVDWLVERFLGRVTTDPTQALQRYSQEIVVQIDLDQLVQRLTNTLKNVLNVKRGGLILTEMETDHVALVPFDTPDVPDVNGKLDHDSPIYQTLHRERSVLLQYDLEYQSRFDTVDPEERAFFDALQMNAYAPIIVGDELIGIIASGPKVGEAPFSPQELSLLVAIANQTGIALRNARLVADLRESEAAMLALNVNLNEAKDQLERLDHVKTDFITIASHELRTPLAQIRGYTDIMQAFSDQGMIDEMIMNDMTAKLRKATGRLEVLISDMLDVSQLDVAAMDLRFVDTKPMSVIRMAIDPLTDAIKDRNLTVVARGLKELPPIRADLERLVQAFRNIITNAIKYTPDGGSIEIVGRVLNMDGGDEPQEIEIDISDTGVGVAEEHLELIFEKFFRGADPSLHSTGATKFMGAGPGLGLTITRGVIEGHGGRVWCESEGFDLENFPGATFYVILPVTPPEDAHRVLPFESSGAATPAPVQ